MSQWAREHPEEMAEIAQLPAGKQLDALRAAHARNHRRGPGGYAGPDVPAGSLPSPPVKPVVRERRFNVIERKRWILVAEWLGDQQSARWFMDKDTGEWYTAKSWQRHNPRGRLSAEAVATVETLVGTEALRQPKPAPPPPPNDRDEAIARIRAGLRKRSGKSWSVTGGRGTVWGWITIHSPPARREQFGYMSDDDRHLLGDLLGCDGPVHPQGVSIPASTDYRREYVDRAEGRDPDVIGKPYWD